MGYYAEQKSTYFLMPVSTFPEATAALHDMIKKLPSWTWEKQEEDTLLSIMDFVQLMKQLDWEVIVEGRDVVDIRYITDKVGGTTRVTLAAIAPYVASDSYIEMIGSDDEMWSWYFMDGKLHVLYPEINWPRPTAKDLITVESAIASLN